MEQQDVQDAVFGCLRWYADGRFYGSEILLTNGSTVLVSFDPQEGELAAMLPSARESLAWVLANDELVRRSAADSLTDLYNSSAHDPAEEPEPISREEFANRVRLASCWFFPNGHVELTYDDADMFGGHSIQVDCDPVSGRIAVES
jgi:hypothetical protein